MKLATGTPLDKLLAGGIEEDAITNVFGPAGSGKTLILAQRAVNAHKRTSGNILILTYNITLRNYILDKISVVKDGLSRKNFGILNYHNFFNIEANNYGLKSNLVN